MSAIKANQVLNLDGDRIGSVVVDSIANMKNLNTEIEANATVELLGYYSKGDGGGGTFYWDSTSIEDDNGGTIIEATGVVDGRYIRNYSGAVNVKWFGAKGDGITDDAISVDNARGAAGIASILLPKGTYLVSANQLQFPYTVIFQEGAKIKTSGTGTVYFNKIEAGPYRIFESDDDFITDEIASTSIKIEGCIVNVDWFASKVKTVAEILYISDQTGNVMKAFRAAAGDYIGTTPNFRTEYHTGVLEFGAGCYRIDKKLAFSKSSSGVYHRVNGFKIQGQGPAATHLIRTDMSNLDYVLFMFYTGELTHIQDFKINSYNPEGGTSEEKYSSAARAGMFLQGDSLQVNNIWVSGMQTIAIDPTDGVARNGVGIQFSSCVDTYMTDVFIENCATGVAFGSSLVSCVNLEVYATNVQAIGFGMFIQEWAGTSPQTTSSRVSISNAQVRATTGIAIKLLEQGQSGDIKIINSHFDGYNSEVSSPVGHYFMHGYDNTAFIGSITNCNIYRYTACPFYMGAGGSMGNADYASNVDNCIIEGQTASGGGYQVFKLNGTGVNNLRVTNTTFKNIRAVLYRGSGASLGQTTFENIYLSNYVGETDGSSSRDLATGGGTLRLINFTRDINDGVQLTRIGWFAGGDLYVDIRNMWKLTRTIDGSATSAMPDTIAFS